jgi:hypothetical protein
LVSRSGKGFSWDCTEKARDKNPGRKRTNFIMACFISGHSINNNDFLFELADISLIRNYKTRSNHLVWVSRGFYNFRRYRNIDRHQWAFVLFLYDHKQGR